MRFWGKSFSNKEEDLVTALIELANEFQYRRRYFDRKTDVLREAARILRGFAKLFDRMADREEEESAKLSRML